MPLAENLCCDTVTRQELDRQNHQVDQGQEAMSASRNVAIASDVDCKKLARFYTDRQSQLQEVSREETYLNIRL